MDGASKTSGIVYMYIPCIIYIKCLYICCIIHVLCSILEAVNKFRLRLRHKVVENQLTPEGIPSLAYTDVKPSIKSDRVVCCNGLLRNITAIVMTGYHISLKHARGVLFSVPVDTFFDSEMR